MHQPHSPLADLLEQELLGTLAAWQSHASVQDFLQGECASCPPSSLASGTCTRLTRMAPLLIAADLDAVDGAPAVRLFRRLLAATQVSPSPAKVGSVQSPCMTAAAIPRPPTRAFWRLKLRMDQLQHHQQPRGRRRRKAASRRRATARAAQYSPKPARCGSCAGTTSTSATGKLQKPLHTVLLLAAACCDADVHCIVVANFAPPRSHHRTRARLGRTWQRCGRQTAPQHPAPA
jgi:hypothetical protein